MKVLLLVKCDLGNAGDEVTGPEVWRACFPCGGEIRALPLDAEAHAEVNRELSTVHPLRRQHLEGQFIELRSKHPAAALASQAAAPPPPDETGAEAGTESTPPGDEAKTAEASAPTEKPKGKGKGGGRGKKS